MFLVTQLKEIVAKMLTGSFKHKPHFIQPESEPDAEKYKSLPASVHFEKYERVRQLKTWLDESYSSHLGEWLQTDGDEYKHVDHRLKKKYSTHQNFCNIEQTVCTLHYTRTNKQRGTFCYYFTFGIKTH